MATVPRARSPVFVSLEVVDSKDPEVQTLALVIAAMDWDATSVSPLKPDAKARIAAWLAAKYPSK